MNEDVLSLLLGTIPWVEAEGKSENRLPEMIAIKTSVYRNFSNYPFTHSCSEAQEKELFMEAQNWATTHHFEQVIPLQKQPTWVVNGLKERFLLTPEPSLAAFRRETPPKFLFFSKNADLHASILGTEHLAVGYLPISRDFEQIQGEAKAKIEPLLEGGRWSTKEDWGPLLASPGGMGLWGRLRIWVHCPFVFLTRAQDQFYNALMAMGFGLGPPQSGSVYGDMVEIQMILPGLNWEYAQSQWNLLMDLLRQERFKAEKVLHQNRARIEDKVFRAWWILNSARLISFSEFSKFSSLARLGAYLQILPPEILTSLEILRVKCAPGHILLGESGRETPQERLEELRAEMVRMTLKEFVDING